jgi:hypothetical protein
MWHASANAFQFDVGNPDIEMEWDNTIRADYDMRLQHPDSFYTNTPLYDEGDLSTPKLSTIQSMLNLYSEFDFKYKETSGFRVSADAWYDPTFKSHNSSNPAFLPNYPGNQYSSYILKYYQGPSAELRDAFGFTSFDLGGHSVDLRLGRTSVTWGQSAFAALGGMNSIAFGQQPLDLNKQILSPNASLKEIELPTGQTYVQTSLTNTLSLAAQYTFEWDHDRLPEGGTFFGPADSVIYGPPVFTYITGPGGVAIPLPNVAPKEGKSGDVGIDLKWRVDAIATTYELAFRHFAMKMPWVGLMVPGAGGGGLPGFTAQYGNDVNLVGAGFNSAVGSAAVAGELSYRWNMPLTPLQGTTLVNNAPTGRTLHGLLNVTQSFGKSALWDNLFVQGEFAFQKLLSVQSNPQNFAMSGYGAACTATGNSPYNGCASSYWMGLAIGASPAWYQVLPGVDLSAPLFFSLNLKGYSPTVNAGVEQQGFNSFMAGLKFEVYNKHEIDLTYMYYMNKKGIGANGATAVGVPYSDKSWLGITYQTTF